MSTCPAFQGCVHPRSSSRVVVTRGAACTRLYCWWMGWTRRRAPAACRTTTGQLVWCGPGATTWVRHDTHVLCRAVLCFAVALHLYVTPWSL